MQVRVPQTRNTNFSLDNQRQSVLQVEEARNPGVKPPTSWGRSFQNVTYRFVHAHNFGRRRVRLRGI